MLFSRRDALVRGAIGFLGVLFGPILSGKQSASPISPNETTTGIEVAEAYKVRYRHTFYGDGRNETVREVWDGDRIVDSELWIHRKVQAAFAPNVSPQGELTFEEIGLILSPVTAREVSTRLFREEGKRLSREMRWYWTKPRDVNA